MFNLFIVCVQARKFGAQLMKASIISTTSLSCYVKFVWNYSAREGINCQRILVYVADLKAVELMKYFKISKSDVLIIGKERRTLNHGGGSRKTEVNSRSFRTFSIEYGRQKKTHALSSFLAA